MPGRFHSLIPFGRAAAFAIMLLAAGEVRAHRLDAQAIFLPGQNQVQIESWFDNGQLARGARVQVFREDGRLLAEGILDQEARFVFSIQEAELLRVVVTAKGGHRKELDIAAEELRRALPGEGKPSGDPATRKDNPPAPVPLGDPHSGERVKDIVIGVSFLLALAAFALSLRNARRLREFKADVRKR